MNRILNRLSAASLGLAVSFLAFLPVVHAQTVPGTTFSAKGLDNLGTYLLSIVYFIDRYIVPVVFALAFIVFLWGIYTTFIAGAASEEKRAEGQKLVMYGLIGFFLMFSVWGLVNLLVGTFGFGGQTRPGLPTFTPGGAAGASANGSSFVNTGGTGATGGTDGSGPCPPGTIYVATYGIDSTPACVDSQTGQPTGSPVSTSPANGCTADAQCPPPLHSCDLATHACR